ncbi:hypothetical protein D4739_14370 [Nocardioides cavernaquae]|uniref:Uncharacterized protein n=1 Tax=Nocardioides cavernaquae TaxID=2321396 RepID=A0A3A5HHW6_9ACTN|nr:hypothetical protein D4739_14370 [Nocardioides cavernaquae]
MRIARVVSGATALTALVALALYLWARNYSAYLEDAVVSGVAYRLVVSGGLLLPGLACLVLALSARKPGPAWAAGALAIGWFVVGGSASYVLGI